MRKISALAAAAISAFIALPAAAQTSTIGQTIFQDRCAACHGAEGKGDGLVAELFRQAPKNLAILAKENGGEFPFERVYFSIDGRLKIQAHGDSNMPIWGEYFMEEALDDQTINPKNAAEVVDGRILSVVYYIQSLQVK